MRADRKKVLVLCKSPIFAVTVAFEKIASPTLLHGATRISKIEEHINTCCTRDTKGWSHRAVEWRECAVRPKENKEKKEKH